MKTTRDYMTDAKDVLGITSDRQMAKWLGIAPSALSHYKTGFRTIDNYAATRIAEALGINPMQVIAVAEMERERDEGRRKFWENFSAGMAKSAVFVLSLLGLWTADGLSNQAVAATSAIDSNLSIIYIMRNLTARLKTTLRRLKNPTSSPRPAFCH